MQITTTAISVLPYKINEFIRRQQFVLGAVSIVYFL